MSTNNDPIGDNLTTSNRLAVLANEIRAAHEDIRQSAEHSARRVCDAGERLMEARDSPDIPFGGYEQWVRHEAGIPRSTAQRYVQLFIGVKQGRISIGDIAEAGQLGALRMLRIEETRARREASLNAPATPDGMDLRIGDCREVLADIPANSFPLILADPPYESAAEPLWRWLGKWSFDILAPGGSLICYFGNTQVDKMHRILGDAGLVHHCAAWMQHDQSQRFAGKFFIAQGKPILWYVKEFRRGRTLVPNVVSDSVRDKSAHNWAQGDGGIRVWIHHLTEPGETIVIPFAGTATWGRIIVEMGRRCIGADIELGGTTTVAA